MAADARPGTSQMTHTHSQDPDTSYLHRLIDKLTTEAFFGTLTIKLAKGRPTSVKQEEALELPSFAIRKAAEHAGRENHEQH